MKYVAFLFAFCVWLNACADPISEIQVVFIPLREATIAARVDSVLLRSRFKIGEKFKKGDVLFELDSQKFAIVLNRAKGKLNFAEKDLQDKKELREKHISSEWELGKSEFDFAMAKADLEEALFNYSCCVIKAPFDGKMAELMTREHETVRNGQPLCRIIADQQLLAVMNVPIHAKALTVPGNEVKIRLGPDKVVRGKIHEVAPVADNRTGTVRIRVLVDNFHGEYSAGLTGVLEHGESR